MEWDWEQRARGLLKDELKARKVSYALLCEKLAEIGVKETPDSIASKLSRGRFSTIFFLQCLTVIGCTELQIKIERKNPKLQS